MAEPVVHPAQDVAVGASTAAPQPVVGASGRIQRLMQAAVILVNAVPATGIVAEGIGRPGPAV